MYMIKTEFMFKGNIKNNSKIYHIHNELHKQLNFHDNLTLKVKVKVPSFKLVQNLKKINEQFKCKVKFKRL